MVVCRRVNSSCPYGKAHMSECVAQNPPRSFSFVSPLFGRKTATQHHHIISLSLSFHHIISFRSSPLFLSHIWSVSFSLFLLLSSFSCLYTFLVDTFCVWFWFSVICFSLLRAHLFCVVNCVFFSADFSSLLCSFYFPSPYSLPFFIYFFPRSLFSSDFCSLTLFTLFPSLSFPCHFFPVSS